MRVAMLSKTDMRGGGASRVATQLAGWLRERGHQVDHFVAHAPGQGTLPAYGAAVHAAKRLEAKVLFNDFAPLEYPSLARLLKPYDVVHFHDLTSAFSAQTIALLARDHNVVWTLHDQSPFTGGCVIWRDCTRVRVGCGECPKRGEWSLRGPVDLTARVRTIKEKLLADARIKLTAPSTWLVEQGVQSGALRDRARVHVIPNGIDLRIYSQRDRQDARRHLGLPLSAHLVLMIAAHLYDEYKIPPSVLSALRASHTPSYFVLVGKGSPQFFTQLGGLRYTAVGPVSDERVKNALYAAADVFLNPSMVESFSLTTLEALASGTPTVAFRTGGIPEIVGDTGALVPPYDAHALVEQLQTAESSEDKRHACRRRAEAAFSQDHVTEQYERIYA